MSSTKVPLKNANLAALLAWLVPGLGHIYQGRTAKGVLYAICILGLFFVGLGLGEGKVVTWRWTNPMHDPENFRLGYLGQFWVGLPALPGLIQGTLRDVDESRDQAERQRAENEGRLTPSEDELRKNHIGPILWGYLAPPADARRQPYGYPEQGSVNAVYPKLGRLVEVGWVYTVIAGLLNVLAIFDAWEGPAHGDEDEPRPTPETETESPDASSESNGDESTGSKGGAR